MTSQRQGIDRSFVRRAMLVAGVMLVMEGCTPAPANVPAGQDLPGPLVGSGGEGGAMSPGIGVPLEAAGGSGHGAAMREPDAAVPGGEPVRNPAVLDAPRGSGGMGGVIDSGVKLEMPTGPGWAGVAGIEDLSMVKPSSGCGKDPGQALGSFVGQKVTIVPKPVRGTGNREFFIKLPTNYDKMKPYRMVFEGPGCGSKLSSVPDFAGPSGAEGVIQIGLISETSCFDDQRTDSIEYKFLEAVYAILQDKICFDQHRVFVSGFSSGAWLSNMMGCVYGSKLIRAIAPSAGGLSTAPGIAPPCTNLPTPGLWNHNENDGTNSPSGTRAAINRALKVNKCQGDFSTSPRAPYQVAASAAASMACERFTTCPKEFPVVLCHPTTGAHTMPSFFPAAAWQFFSAL